MLRTETTTVSNIRLRLVCLDETKILVYADNIDSVQDYPDDEGSLLALKSGAEFEIKATVDDVWDLLESMNGV